MASPWWDVASVPASRGIRSYGSVVELNGFIYVFGGLSGALPSEEVLNTTWIYDEANDSWFRGANMPGFRFGPGVATNGAVIWVIGGYNQFQGADHNVWRYDPKADSYSTGFRDIPRDLGRIHGAWLPNGAVHVFGGNGPGPINQHLVYDTIADAWSYAPPVPRGVLDPATVTDGTLIYLAGAPDDLPRGPALTQIFDPARGTWSEGQPLPTWPHFPERGIDNTSGTIANGVFYVMGGSTGGTGTAWFNYSIPLFELSASSR
jgi:N-acetylneuraminic acid mutarotase